jgi:hypothetical protein
MTSRMPSLYLVMLSFLFISSSCNRGAAKSGASVTWRTDKAPIEKRIPLSGSFEECIWQGGQHRTTVVG